MDTNAVENEKKLDDFVKELKATLFDVIALNESKLGVLENSIVNLEDESQEENLRNFWSQYNSSLKNVVLCANELVESLTVVDSLSQAFDNLLQNENTEVVQQEKALVNPTENSIQSDEEAAVENTVDEDEEEAVVEDTADEDEEEAVVENTADEDEEEAVVEDTADEDEEEAVVEDTVDEDEKEVAVEDATDENKVLPEEDQVIVPINMEEGKTENTDEQVVSVPVIPVVENSITEEKPVEASTNDNASPSTELIPLAVEDEESKTSDVTTTSQATDIPVIGTADSTVVIPALGNEAADTTTSSKVVFVKETADPAKAIVVTGKVDGQASKLRQSKDEKKALFEAIVHKTTDENITKEQIEEMMSQLPTVYEQDPKKAEELSAKISAYTKKLSGEVA